MDQTAVDILSSDVKIVDSTSRTVDAERGVQALRFPGQYMPDGKDYVAEAPAKLDPSILRGWCNAVRGEANARESRAELEAARAANLYAEGAAQADRAPRESTPTGGGASDDGEASETSLAENLKAEVARWARLELRQGEEWIKLTELASDAGAKREQYARNHLKAQKVLAFYLAQEDNGIAPEDL